MSDTARVIYLTFLRLASFSIRRRCQSFSNDIHHGITKDPISLFSWGVSRRHLFPSPTLPNPLRFAAFPAKITRIQHATCPTLSSRRSHSSYRITPLLICNHPGAKSISQPCSNRPLTPPSHISQLQHPPFPFLFTTSSTHKPSPQPPQPSIPIFTTRITPSIPLTKTKTGTSQATNPSSPKEQKTTPVPPPQPQLFPRCQKTNKTTWKRKRNKKQKRGGAGWLGRVAVVQRRSCDFPNVLSCSISRPTIQFHGSVAGTESDMSSHARSSIFGAISPTREKCRAQSLSTSSVRTHRKRSRM